jgi:two-component system LytT family response regulator
MIRALVVDDEPPARRRLTRMLRRVQDLQVMGEADTGASAVALIEAVRPDLVLLDIHLPDFDGFNVIRLLTTPLPAIVFVTAYDHHAVSAFEAAALDYLLKPVKQARLEQALGRVRAGVWKAGPTGSLESVVAARPGAPPLARLPVRDRGGVLIVPVSDITSIVVDRGLVFVTTAQGRFSTKYTTLQEIERALPPTAFHRVHRQALVSLDHVCEVYQADNATARLRLSCGAEVPVSRSQLPDIRALLHL